MGYYLGSSTSFGQVTSTGSRPASSTSTSSGSSSGGGGGSSSSSSSSGSIPGMVTSTTHVGYVTPAPGVGSNYYGGTVPASYAPKSIVTPTTTVAAPLTSAYQGLVTTGGGQSGEPYKILGTYPTTKTGEAIYPIETKQFIQDVNKEYVQSKSVVTPLAASAPSQAVSKIAQATTAAATTVRDVTSKDFMTAPSPDIKSFNSLFGIATGEAVGKTTTVPNLFAESVKPESAEAVNLKIKINDYINEVNRLNKTPPILRSMPAVSSLSEERRNLEKEIKIIYPTSDVVLPTLTGVGMSTTGSFMQKAVIKPSPVLTEAEKLQGQIKAEREEISSITGIAASGAKFSQTVLSEGGQAVGKSMDLYGAAVEPLTAAVFGGKGQIYYTGAGEKIGSATTVSEFDKKYNDIIGFQSPAVKTISGTISSVFMPPKQITDTLFSRGTYTQKPLSLPNPLSLFDYPAKVGKFYSFTEQERASANNAAKQIDVNAAALIAAKNKQDEMRAVSQSELTDYNKAKAVLEQKYSQYPSSFVNGKTIYTLPDDKIVAQFNKDNMILIQAGKNLDLSSDALKKADAEAEKVLIKYNDLIEKTAPIFEKRRAELVNTYGENSKEIKTYDNRLWETKFVGTAIGTVPFSPVFAAVGEVGGTAWLSGTVGKTAVIGGTALTVYQIRIGTPLLRRLKKPVSMLLN